MAKKKYIETPERMMEMFKEYKEYTKSHPRYKYQLSQRTGEMIPEPLEVPLTMEGFEIYCYENFSVSLDHYFRNTDNSYTDYLSVCTHIRQQIREDQIRGGMVGQYNPSITQRLNGLTDKQQIDTDGKIEVVFVKGKTIL